jgi:alpha-mannosidase
MTEIPFGSMERPTDGKEFPALRWIDLSNSEQGATLVNDCKYGFSADGNNLRATLIRSTYDPDAYPELGRHDIRFGLVPHSGPCDTASATRTAEAFNQPMCVIGTDIHAGALPVSSSYAELLTPNVSIAAMKKAEDTDAVIIRLYETAGIRTEARIRLTGIVKSGTKCVDVDLMEQPTGTSTAYWDGDILVVPVAGHGISTVMIA